MLETLGREKLIISNIYKSDKPITSQTLADEISVSVRTIKSDMIKVRDVLSEVGAELISVRHKGYSIKVHNFNLFEPFINQLTYSQIVIDSFYNDRSSRFVFISRELVASDDYIKIDDLADQMYLSRSSIKPDLQRAYSFLNSYHIEVDSKPGLGIKAIGTEENLRMAMTELVVNHYHQIHVINTSKNFAKVIESTDEERQTIRRTYLKVYRESGQRATDAYSLSFAFYLLIAKNRIKSGHHVFLSEEIKHEARSLEEYPIAVDIANVLKQCDLDLSSIDEQAHMAIMLHGMRDLNELDKSHKCYYSKEAEETVKEILDVIKKDWGIDFKQINGIDQLLRSSVIKIIGQIRFGLSSHQSIGFSQSSHDIAGSPLSIEFGRRALRLIEDKYYCRLNTKAVVELAYSFYEAISSVEYDIKKLRLLTTSTGGLKAGKGLVNRIQKHYGPFIESNESVELYEIRGMDPKEYDFVILDSPSYSYFYDIPPFFMSSISKPHRYTEMFDDIFVNSYQFKKCIIDLTETQVFRQFKFENINSFFKLIAYKHGKTEVECQQLETILEENEKFLSYDILENIVSIFLPINMCKNSGIEIYEFNESKHWTRGDISYAVVYSLGLNNSIYRTKAIENISRSLITSKEKFNDLIDEPNLDKYEALIKESLTAE